MARRNPGLLALLPLPLERLPDSDCGACDSVGLVVAAKWPALPEDRWVSEASAEYLCYDCGLVFENSYHGALDGPNWHPARPDDLLDSIHQ